MASRAEEGGMLRFGREGAGRWGWGWRRIFGEDSADPLFLIFGAMSVVRLAWAS